MPRKLIIDTDPGGECPLTILALGPLTNLARALQQDPGLAERVEEVVVMGGNALGPGNATPAAEANVWNDAEAADFVFGGHPAGGQTRHRPRLAMVGLDVTREVVMSGEEVAALSRAASDTAHHLGAVVSKYLSFFRHTHDRDGIVLHDPTAVVYLIDRGLFKTERWPLRVEVEGLSRGKTWPPLGTTERPPKPWQGARRFARSTFRVAGSGLPAVRSQLTGPWRSLRRRHGISRNGPRYSPRSPGWRA